MPSPVYIIVCDSGAEDKLTGLLSHYGVLEKIAFTQDATVAREMKMPSASVRFRGTAVWKKSKEDEDNRDYQYQSVLCLPDGSEQVAQEGAFAFPPGKSIQRFILLMEGPFVTAAGILAFESRVRRDSNEPWQRQRYEIIVEELCPEEKKPANP